MASKYDTSVYKKLLLHFMGELDPLYSMLQWQTERMMEMGAELRVGAVKGKHAIDRKTNFSGQGRKEDSAREADGPECLCR